MKFSQLKNLDTFIAKDEIGSAEFIKIKGNKTNVICLSSKSYEHLKGMEYFILGDREVVKTC